MLALFLNDVDSNNLGKGMWAWTLSTSMTNDGFGSQTSWFSYLRNTQHLDYLITKAGNGDSLNSQYTKTMVNNAHAAGLKIVPYFYLYGDFAQVTSPDTAANHHSSAEAAVFNNVFGANGAGGDFAIFDIESEYGDTDSAGLINYFNLIGKSASGNGSGSRDNLFMAYSTFDILHFHYTQFPCSTIADYCDAAMPQMYWKAHGYSISFDLQQVDADFENTTYVGVNGVKPVIPTGQTYAASGTANPTATETNQWYNAIKADTSAVGGTGAPSGWRYKGLNYFDEHTLDRDVSGNFIAPASSSNRPQRDEVAAEDIGDLPGTPASPSPANNATLSTSPATLDWADVVNTYGTGSVGAATKYDVYIDGVKKTTIDVMTASSSYPVSPALSAGNHTWQIVAKNMFGSMNGPTWNFTISPPLLNPPSNLAASDGAYQDHVALSWSAVSGASKYQLYRNTTNDPATATMLAQPTGTTYDDFTATANITYYYWAATFNSSNVVGNKGTADTGFADTLPPTVTARNVQTQFDPPYVSFTFSEPVGSSINLASISFTNLDSPGGPTPSASSYSYIAASNTAKLFLDKPIPDGNFRATISGVRDTAANSFAATDNSQDFYFLAGDANGDRVVNALDFNALANHFGFAGAGFAGGDFDFSGVVNTADFSLLASHWLASTPAPAPAPTVPLGSLFADTLIKPNDPTDTSVASIESLL